MYITVLKLRLTKNRSRTRNFVQVDEHNSIGLDLIIRVCDHQLRRLFGEYGRLEFVIEPDFLYDHNLDEWLIKIKRKVDDTVMWYEMSIDNQTGQVTLFRRITDE